MASYSRVQSVVGSASTAAEEGREKTLGLPVSLVVKENIVSSVMQHFSLLVRWGKCRWLTRDAVVNEDNQHLALKHSTRTHNTSHILFPMFMNELPSSDVSYALHFCWSAGYTVAGLFDFVLLQFQVAIGLHSFQGVFIQYLNDELGRSRPSRMTHGNFFWSGSSSSRIQVILIITKRIIQHFLTLRSNFILSISIIVFLFLLFKLLQTWCSS